MHQHTNVPFPSAPTVQQQQQQQPPPPPKPVSSYNPPPPPEDVGEFDEIYDDASSGVCWPSAHLRFLAAGGGVWREEEWRGGGGVLGLGCAKTVVGN